MLVEFEIIKISPIENDSIDYNTIIFKIFLNEKVDVENSKELLFHMKTLINGRAKKILIDMKNLESIDSSGIGVLINSAKLLRANNGDIVFANISNEIKNIFKVINLQNYIEIFNTDVEAENHFRYIK